jgi:hypothetical protein
MRGLNEGRDELALPLSLRPALGVLVEYQSSLFVNRPLHAPPTVVILSLLETTAAGLLAVLAALN